MATVLAAVLAACTVGPDYVRPAVETPQAFKEQWKTAEPRDQRPRGEWWEVFGDSTLDGLVAQVDIDNQNIRIAEANVRQARSLSAQARAAFFPAVTGNASAVRGSVSGSSRGLTGTSSGGVANTYNVNLDATWELDLWGRVRRNVESAEANVGASEADLAGA